MHLYLGRNGRVWCCRSLLGTMLKRMALNISTGDELVGYGGVDLYWGPINRVVNLGLCDRVCSCRSLLETLW